MIRASRLSRTAFATRRESVVSDPTAFANRTLARTRAALEANLAAALNAGLDPEVAIASATRRTPGFVKLRPLG